MYNSFFAACIRLTSACNYFMINFSSAHCLGTPNSPATQQNSEASAAAAGGAQRSAKEQSARRKDEAKQAAKKPKENALSQFDLNNYASK